MKGSKVIPYPSQIAAMLQAVRPLQISRDVVSSNSATDDPSFDVP